MAEMVSAQPATVNGELALGLLRLADADAFQVGTMPDELRTFLPDSAIVVGTLDQTSEKEGWGSHSTVLARIPGDADEAAAEYTERTFPGRDTRNDSDTRGGFASTRGPTRVFQYYPKTRDGQIVNVSFEPRPWGGSYVRIVRRPLYAQERLPSEARPERPVFLDLEPSLPLLTAPRRTRLQQTGSGGGDDSYRSRAILGGATIGIPMDTVATHFGSQLEEGGWDPGGAVIGPDLATSTWTRTWAGKALAAMFYARRMDDGRIDLALHVTGPSQ